ncbi:tol-pal system protein YbgF [Emcibacter sp. SYSU 3D8]|uniref:tol-pal system protein YbgF n=1 Tax=Emcibacter sp. SYSU 3D8 TaxID=3133969 RepID=UPI0031FEA557
MRWQSLGIVSLFALLGTSTIAVAQPQLDTYRAQNEVRLTRIENDIRRLTGGNEEAMYRLTQLNQQLEKQLEDMQFRIDTLEKQLAAVRSGQAQSGQAQDGESQDAQGFGAPGAMMPPDGTADDGMDYGQGMAGDAPTGMQDDGSGPGGRVPDTLGGQLDSPGGTPPPPKGTPEETPERYLEGDGPDAQFNYAFSLLRRDDFQGAEEAFRAFLALNPDHRAAPNAKYWLGKTYYATRNYAEAARVLLDGFKQFADSDKGPDMMLTLGLSLRELGQKDQACATFDELSRRYPKATPSIRQKTEAAQQATGCN